MQVDAIYDNGTLRLPEHIKLRHGRIKLTVRIPDEDIIQQGQSTRPPAKPGSLQARLNAVLGKAAMERREASPAEDREAFNQLMEERNEYRNG